MKGRTEETLKSMKKNKKMYFLDLDGTILHHHRECESFESEVEWSKGKNISVMMNEVYEIIKERPRNVVFVTARSYPQCLRVKGLVENARYILADNGGTLIRDGKIDMNWLNETNEKLSWTREIMDNIWRKINKSYTGEVKYVNSMYIFYSGENKDILYRELREDEEVTEYCRVYDEGKRVVIIPNSVTKYACVKRFIDKYKDLHEDKLDIRVFGDSEVDVGMGLVTTASKVYTVDKDKAGDRVDKKFVEMYFKDKKRS